MSQVIMLTLSLFSANLSTSYRPPQMLLWPENRQLFRDDRPLLGEPTSQETALHSTPPPHTRQNISPPKNNGMFSCVRHIKQRFQLT